MQQHTTDTWNGMTNYQLPQEFMDISRQRWGVEVTIDAAVRAYVDEIAPDWAGEGLTVEEAEDVCGNLVAYLDRTRGVEWDVAEEPSAADAIGRIWDEQ